MTSNDFRFDVAGLGNALIDALVRIDDGALLQEAGFPRGQMSQVDNATWQGLYKRLEPHGIELQSGGSCANTIAALGLLGTTSRYCGQVGRDRLGELYSERLTEACGGHALHWTDAHSTGKCLSVISTRDAERTMLTDLGAAVHLADLGEFSEVIRESRLLHLTAYLFLGEPMTSRALEAIAIANQTEIPVSLDVADPFVVSTCRAQIWEVLEEFTDIVFLNADEARALCECEPEEAIHKIGEVVETVVVKLGKQGSMVLANGELIRIEVDPVDAVDTTGAGDSYAAGFLYGVVRGWPLRDAAKLGSAIAAHTVCQVGAVVRNAELLRTTANTVRPQR